MADLINLKFNDNDAKKYHWSTFVCNILLRYSTNSSGFFYYLANSYSFSESVKYLSYYSEGFYCYSSKLTATLHFLRIKIGLEVKSALYLRVERNDS
jgi:hypothetical protein